MAQVLTSCLFSIEYSINRKYTGIHYVLGVHPPCETVLGGNFYHSHDACIL
jgi:hypothetical protein